MSSAWHDQPWPRALFTAVQFLTRIPVPGGATRDLSTFPEDIRRGLIFFPAIGALVGALTAGALALFASVLPFAIAVILALAVEALVTGAFHEDAVADFFDAFGGGWTRLSSLRGQRRVLAIRHGGPIAAIRGTLGAVPVREWPSLVPRTGESVELDLP